MKMSPRTELPYILLELIISSLLSSKDIYEKQIRHTSIMTLK